MPNIKYYSISPSSDALSLIGTPGLYPWFADSSGQWVRGDQVGTPPTSAAFAVLALISGDPPAGATYIDNIPTAGTKDPYPPPPPVLELGVSEATYSSQFASLVPRSIG
jgi:hypothetical protein